ncbi:MAG TPA: RNA methyltransferase [Cyclobacteriaceae bacterium]|nr:RNA methyltransferase [Cyclobacteriaceae bacterium]
MGRIDLSVTKIEDKKLLLEFLEQYLSHERKQRFEEVLKLRTRHIVAAAEDIYQERNASALIRTADCFGIQDVHIIENYNKYKLSEGIAKGADKWIDVNLYDGAGKNTERCIKALREKGYRIVAASPHNNDYNPDEIDITKKLAIFFGGEKEGLSMIVSEEADTFLKIPMSGFTESFNLSVAGGIILYALTKRLRESGISWQLTEEEKDELRLKWTYNSIKRPEKLIAKFMEMKNEKRMQ